MSRRSPGPSTNQMPMARPGQWRGGDFRQRGVRSWATRARRDSTHRATALAETIPASPITASKDQARSAEYSGNSGATGLRAIHPPKKRSPSFDITVIDQRVRRNNGDANPERGDAKRTMNGILRHQCKPFLDSDFGRSVTLMTLVTRNRGTVRRRRAESLAGLYRFARILLNLATCDPTLSQTPAPVPYPAHRQTGPSFPVRLRISAPVMHCRNPGVDSRTSRRLPPIFGCTPLDAQNRMALLL